jgi:hypothetical protein
MTVKKLISILKKLKDPDIAEMTFYVGEKSYDIKSIGQFGLITDANITLTEIKNPMMSTPTFQRSKRKMISSTMKRIKKDMKIK